MNDYRPGYDYRPGGRVPISHDERTFLPPDGGSVPPGPGQNFHVPQIAPSTDGRWGVFCAACSAQAGDYVYPCPQWAEGEYPVYLLEES